ncbi:hypothetical protein AB9F45_39385, partial [Rhizobium leguminosarum]
TAATWRSALGQRDRATDLRDYFAEVVSRIGGNEAIRLHLLAYPYLGPAFEFQGKTPGQWPLLRDIHRFNSAAVPSLG